MYSVKYNLQGYLIISSKKPLMTAKIILKAIAHQKLLTLNPGTMAATKSTKSALITKVNNPKVRIFRGNVSTIRIGLIMVLTIPINIATSIEAKRPVTVTPGKI